MSSPASRGGAARRTAVVCFVLGALAATTATVSAVSGTPGAAPPDPDQTAPFLTPADQPALSDADVARADSDVRTDQRMRSLLGGTTYQIVETGIWTSGGKQQKLGAMVHLHLDSPATLHGRWPRMHYDQTEQTSPPFKDGEVNETAASVSDLYLLVDLKNDHVVNALPGPGSVVTDSAATSPASSSNSTD